MWDYIQVSADLFDSGRLPTAWREARIELGPVGRRGGVVALESSIRRRRPPAPGIPPPRPPSSEEFDEFPLICTPVTVPWFAPGFARDSDCGGLDDGDGRRVQRPPTCRRTPAEALALLTDVELGPRAPHVLFVGLTFLWQRTLTIDVDDRRMTIV